MDPNEWNVAEPWNDNKTISTSVKHTERLIDAKNNLVWSVVSHPVHVKLSDECRGSRRTPVVIFIRVLVHYGIDWDKVS